MAILDLIERNRCPLCLCVDNTVHIPFPQIPVVRCDRCGFLFSRRIMSPEALGSYYKNDFASLRHLRGQIVNAEINIRIMTRLIDMSGVKEVLDIGTGYGFLLQKLCQTFDVNVTGVELSQEEATHAKEELKLDVRNAPLSEAGLEKEFYDLVTSFETIEHISEPVQFIRDCSEYLKPGGCLLIMTDNFESRMATALGAGFPKWIPHAHVNHFAPNTFKRIISGASGLSVYRAGSYTPWEIYLRNIYYRIRGIKKSPEEAFQLSTVLESEMGGTFRMFKFRKHFNRVWAQITYSQDLDGDLMYIAAKKKGQVS